MELALKAAVQKLIDDRVRNGRYATPEDVVSAAIVALDQQESLGDFVQGELDELLAEGERSIESEGTLDGAAASRKRQRRRARARRGHE